MKTTSTTANLDECVSLHNFGQRAYAHAAVAPNTSVNDAVVNSTSAVENKAVKRAMRLNLFTTVSARYRNTITSIGSNVAKIIPTIFVTLTRVQYFL